MKKNADSVYPISNYLIIEFNSTLPHSILIICFMKCTLCHISLRKAKIKIALLCTYEHAWNKKGKKIIKLQFTVWLIWSSLLTFNKIIMFLVNICRHVATYYDHLVNRFYSCETGKDLSFCFSYFIL